jgi:DNA repair exonuclease SbcCD ATPase subunit
LTDKLDLARQLSTLKPELDHLRAQVASNQDLLSEKLALQRQVSEIEIELDHAKSEAKRAIAKRRNTQHDLNQQDTIDDLRKAITREKRLREKAQEDLETAQAELEREKENAQRKNTTEAAKAEESASVQVETEELRRQLAKERKERERTEKTHQKTQSDWDATKAILDDKLNQFRSKLKSTKEKLKETETQLEDAQRSAAAGALSVPVAAEKATKQTKKRSAAQMDPDSQKLGTPGQAKPAKKGRKAAGVGDKSTFSITPFLNRTMSVAPESPEQVEQAEAAAQESESEVEPDTPIAANVQPTTESAPKPLATVPASKSNIKKAKPAAEPKPKKQTKKQALEQVIEEVEPTSQEEATATTKVPTFKAKKTADGETKPKPKQRKSLATFAAFTHEPEPEKKQKKRKLGGLGKTLFDDEDDAPSKPLPGRGGGLFGASRLGPLAAGGVRGSFIGGMGKKKSGLLTADDGFMFSPLKKERKAMASFIQ